MNMLGKYCHDFPRLAKESGYMFHLYRGRINWSELGKERAIGSFFQYAVNYMKATFLKTDKVNVQEIIDEKNFQLLEQNLIHVINCNLEREYDIKILDQNFVKLFKLAQLGIDYLSYCELYLDRCVILLQEQLANCQEECGLLREEIEKKDEELQKSKKKAKIQSQKYKCNKCSKIFLNETYLESHERRRHKSSLESNENKHFYYSEQAQQTETQKISSSVFTQTIDFPMPSNVSEFGETNGTEILKRSEQEVKIDNLKRDLEELKIRLTLAEKTMEEKKNDERTYTSSFPSAVIPVIHSYISPCNGHVPVLSTTPAIIPTASNQPPVREEVADTQEIDKKANKLEYEFSIYDGNIFGETRGEETSGQKLFTPERFPAEGASTVRSGSVNSNEMFGNMYEGLKDDHPHTPYTLRPYTSSDNNIMDVRPKPDKKPLENEDGKRNLLSRPKPQMFFEVGNLTNDFPSTLKSSPVYSHSDLKIELETASESLDPRTSTPVKGTLEDRSGKNETKWDIEMAVREERRERRRKSQATPVRDMNSLDGEGKPKSLFRKIVKKKSPKIQELTVNLKNSISQLYGSVSSAGKKNSDEEPGIALGKTKSDIVEGLHKRLRELGIDPEWSGIPKETMKQKLNILEHNRNFLSKESRLYPYLRRKLQKHVLKKLKGHSLPSKGKAQFSAESLESVMGEPSGTSTENVIMGETSEVTIYDSDGDCDFEVKPQIPLSSESQSKAQNISLDSIEPIKLGVTSPGETKWGEERETTDFSIFQAGKFKSSTVKGPQLEIDKSKAETVVDELETDSDFDDELFKELERESIHCTPDKSPRKDVIASFPAKPEEYMQEEGSRSAKAEGQSILKSEVDNKSHLMSKKKVLFAEEAEIFESTSKTTKFPLEKQKIFDLSSVVDDDDDWSIESDGQ